MWTWSIVWNTLILFSYPFLFIRLQRVCEFGQFFSSSHLIVLSIIIFYLQDVRELVQLCEYYSSDPPTPSSLSVSREYVKLGDCLKLLIWSSYLSPLHPSPDRMWTWPIALIPLIWSIPSLPHHPSPARMWALSNFEYISSDHPIPCSSFISRMCVNLINCF